jgi:DUF1680 family protein
VQAVAYAPGALTTDVRGHTVEVEVDAEYPFDDTIEIRLRTDGSLNVPLRLRIPECGDGPRAAARELGSASDDPLELRAGARR